MATWRPYSRVSRSTELLLPVGVLGHWQAPHLGLGTMLLYCNV